MRTLLTFLGAGTMIALLGWVQVAIADVRNDSIKPLEFTIGAGDGSVDMPSIKFDTDGTGEEAQRTCAMTPGMPDLLLEQPVTTSQEPEHLAGYQTSSPAVTLAPISSLQTPPPYSSARRWYPDDPEVPVITTDEPGTSPPLVPEPATVLLIGIGIAGVAVARRRWTKA